MKWNNLLLLAFFCGAVFLGGPVAEASPGVIVDQYDYQDGEITISYPHFDGVINQAAQDKLNEAMETLVEQIIDDAHTRIENAKQYNTHEFSSEVRLNYKVWYNDENIVSVTLKSYKFFGGAHGMSGLMGYTFNLQSGEVVPYADIFKWDSDSRKLAYSRIINQVNDRKLFLFTDGQQNKLASKLQDPDYEPNYYLADKDKAVIIFSQGEIAASAAGVLQFNM
jgi:hypothetical protein